jgi:hypothetical protein
MPFSVHEHHLVQYHS